MSDKVCTYIKVYKRSHNKLKVPYILLMNLDPAILYTMHALGWYAWLPMMVKGKKRKLAPL